MGRKRTEHTPTERRILALLADGQPHTRLEVFRCLFDDLGPLSNIKRHISKIRKALEPRGEDIVCVIVSRRICYRHVRLLPSAKQGKS